MASYTANRPSPTEWGKVSNSATSTTAISDVITFGSDCVLQHFCWLQPSSGSASFTFRPQGNSSHDIPIVNASTDTSGNAGGGWPFVAGDQLVVSISGGTGDRAYVVYYGGKRE